MKLARLTVLTAALCLAALPASAGAAGPPAGTPGLSHMPADVAAALTDRPTATDNPGSAHVPTLEQARAIGRRQCQEFKANFADNRQQFGKCVSAGVRVLRTSALRSRRVTPHQACGDLGLSRKREPGEARSDFNACVVAAARGAREGEEGVTAS